MDYQTEQQINELVEGFNKKTLPKDLWTHEAHLTTAIWHLKKYDINEATCLLKSGIISYNISLGGTNNGTSGYHETLTIFWITVIDYYVRINQPKSLLETCNSFLKCHLADKTLPFIFYEKANLLSSAARARFIHPDKRKLNDSTLASFQLASL